jgi:hypothetical protein
MSDNDWAEYKRLMLDNQERMDRALAELRCEVTGLRMAIEAIKTKLTMSAGMASLAGAGLVTLLIKLLTP